MRANPDRLVVFPWSRNFETGIPLVDKQHRVLVDLLNKYANCLIALDTIEIDSAFDELANYAALHFDDEETIWLEFFEGDPWASSHKMKHDTFLPAIANIKERNIGSDLHDIVEEIVHFLIRWLALHIIEDDKRMAFAVEAAKSGALLEEAKVFADKKMSGTMQELIGAILEMYSNLSSIAIDLMGEINTRKSVEQELKKTNNNLQIALDEVKTLQGIIPICSYCHSIRDDDGAWDRVEIYISKNSDAMFSHGICPKCLDDIRFSADPRDE